MSKELVIQNDKYYIRKLINFLCKQGSGSYYIWLTKTGDWTRNRAEAGEFNSEEEAEKHLFRVIKTYE